MKFLAYMFIIFTLSAQTMLAASLTLVKSNTSDIKVGDEILVDVVLATGEESYNAVSGTLFVDQNLEVRQIKTGGSIISAWIEHPGDATTNIIHFSGIIAGGFKGTGTVLQAVVVPKRNGELSITLENSTIFKNDGAGTEEVLPKRSTVLSARNLLSGETNTKITLVDTISPERFEAILVKDANIADGNYVIVFEAVDKGSGVKTYEVMEGKKLFKQARSPYVLENQRINERIYVKAIDFDGNERVARVDIPDTVCIGAQCFNQNIIIIILIVAFILSLFIWRKQSAAFKKISKRA